MLALDAGPRVHAREAERAGHRHGVVRERLGAVGRTRLEQRGDEPGQQLRAVRSVVAQQRHGAVEEADLTGEVAAAVRHLGRRGESPAGAHRELGGRSPADLFGEAPGSLEVEADARVGLRQLGAERGEPVGVPLVQARSRGLRQRCVRDVADQRVPEAQRARARAAHQQIALHQPLAGARDVGPGDPGGQRVHRGGVEGVARDRAERQRRALCRVEPVEPRREQRLQRGRQRVRGAALADVGDELLEEERVAARGLRDLSLRGGREPAAAERGEQRVAGCGRQRPQL